MAGHAADVQPAERLRLEKENAQAGRDREVLLLEVVGADPVNDNSPAGRRRAGARRRFHDLRHSGASLMSALRIPLEVVSEVLAHSGIQITADLYGHLEDEVLREPSEEGV